MKFYKTKQKHCCAVIAVTDDGMAIADPCYLVPEDAWAEFCKTFIPISCSKEATYGERKFSFEFRGARFDGFNTDGDGFFEPGIAVDTGCICRVKFDEIKALFPQLNLIAL